VLARLPRLELEVGAVRSLIIVIVAGSNRDLLGAPLLPIFAAFSAFLSALADGFGRCTPPPPGLLPGTIFPSPLTKVAPTASSSEE
jgi:hypothetical protein